MKKFKNDFSWSFSRSRMYNECPKKYYLYYYGSNNGWDKNADEKTKKIYLLKKITNRFFLSGSMVHSMIEQILKNHIDGIETPIDRAKDFLIRQLKNAYKESITQEWKLNLKKCNLQEHYFNHNITDQQWVNFRESAVNCLESFYVSDEYKKILSIPTNDWITIESLDSFNYFDTKIYASPDFAYKENDSIKIIDWKTGKPSANDEVQLLSYAVYGHHKWDVDYSQLELSDVYLKNNTSIDAENLEEKIPVIESVIQTSILEMKSLLDDVENNTAIESNFEMTANQSTCKYCNFKEICHPNNYEEL